MKRGKTYYAVVDDSGITYTGPMVFSPDRGSKKPEMALWFGSHGTLFGTYEQARSAIRQTCRYAKRQDLPWPLQYKIVRMRLADPLGG